MIIVPETQTGAESAENIPDPAQAPRLLAAQPARADAAAREYGAVFMGFKRREDAAKRADALSRDERGAEALAREILDHAAVKDAVTQLHREDDAQMADLARCDGVDIADIVKKQETFVRSQEAKYAALFGEGRRKALFRKMTRDYFDRALRDARALRNRKILAYQEEVIGRQNAEFLDRALRPETLFDDAAQTGYRDMLLFNLENLHAELSEPERRKRLDEASRDFYQSILEKRLETDPSRMRAMLDAPAVRRVLGGEPLAELESRAAAAVRDDELAIAARRWVAEDVPPSAANQRAKDAYADSADRESARKHYRFWRQHDNRRRFLSIVVEIQQAWEAAAAGEYRRSAIPARLKRNRPDVYAFLADSLDRRAQNGGLPPEPDCAAFADFAAGYDPAAAFEKLRDEKGVLAFIDRLGGPDGVLFQAALRLLIGKSTQEDAFLLTDLRAAREALRANGEEIDRAAFFAAFMKARRIQTARDKVEELTDAEVRELVDECLEAGAARNTN